MPRKCLPSSPGSRGPSARSWPTTSSLLTRSYLTSTYKIPVLQFGEEDVRALLSQVTRRAPQAVRHAKNVLSCAFAYGKEHIHGVKSNPCQGVKVTVPNPAEPEPNRVG